MSTDGQHSREARERMQHHFRPRRGLATQALLLTGATAASQLATAAMYVLAARGSDPADFGVVVGAIAAGTTVAGCLDFGTNAYWTREIARGAHTGRSLSSRATAKMLFGLLIAAAISVVSGVLFPAAQFWIAGAIGFAYALSQTWRVPLMGLGRADLAALPTALDRLLAACIGFAAIAAGVSGSTALWIALVAGALLSALIARALTPRTDRLAIEIRRGSRPWSGAKSYGLGSVAVSAQSLDITLLGVIASPAAAAMYGAVSRWTQPMNLMANAFATSAAPFMANSGSLGAAVKQTKRALWFPAAAVLLSLLVIVFAPEMIQVLLGAEYAAAAPVLRWLGVAAILAIANQVCIVMLQSLGHDRSVARLLAGGVLLHLALVCVLSITHGAVGAAVALVIMQGLLVLSLVAYTAWARHASTKARPLTEHLHGEPFVAVHPSAVDQREAP
jgi:O-antigen/teichoic acid export membrane protein